MNPLISIIVPCYNVEAYLDRCIDSLIHQTIGLDQLEIILVNDASTDSTYDKLCAWEKRYPDNILVINCAENGRQGTARNLGINYANGTYIAFVDSDDWVELDMYEFMTQKAISYHADMVICNMDGCTSNGTSTPCTHWKDEFTDIQTVEEKRTFLLKYRHYLSCMNLIYNRNWFITNQLFFPEKLFHEDHIMYLIYASANRIATSERVLYHYFLNNSGTIRTNKNPFDRVLVHAQIYSRLREPQFSDIKDISDYNYFDKCFGEVALCGVIPSKDRKLLQSIKDILFENIPDICSNPYYRRDIPLPYVSGELLLHPLVEEDITEEAFELFLRRADYCHHFPGALVYCDLFTQVRRELQACQDWGNMNSDIISEALDELLKICQRYCFEPFAHMDAAESFLKDIAKICDSENFDLQKFMSHIYDFSVIITLP